MTETEISDIHGDLEILKRDVAEIKEVLLGAEGELAFLVKERVTMYTENKKRKFISQEEIEKEF